VVAVVLGHFLGGEMLDARTVLGTILVIVSVIVITTRRGADDTADSAEGAALSDANSKPDSQP